MLQIINLPSAINIFLMKTKFPGWPGPVHGGWWISSADEWFRGAASLWWILIFLLLLMYECALQQFQNEQKINWKDYPNSEQSIKSSPGFVYESVLAKPQIAHFIIIYTAKTLEEMMKTGVREANGWCAMLSIYKCAYDKTCSHLRKPLNRMVNGCKS